MKHNFLHIRGPLMWAKTPFTIPAISVVGKREGFELLLKATKPGSDIGTPGTRES